METCPGCPGCNPDAVECDEEDDDQGNGVEGVRAAEGVGKLVEVAADDEVDDGAAELEASFKSHGPNRSETAATAAPTALTCIALPHAENELARVRVPGGVCERAMKEGTPVMRTLSSSTGKPIAVKPSCAVMVRWMSVRKSNPQPLMMVCMSPWTEEDIGENDGS